MEVTMHKSARLKMWQCLCLVLFCVSVLCDDQTTTTETSVTFSDESTTAELVSTPDTPSDDGELLLSSMPTAAPNFKESLQKLVTGMMDKRYREVLRFIIESDISQECNFHLLKVSSALRSLEPWVMRLLDASGKMPVGMFQGTLSDLGAYDECLETIVRDQHTGEINIQGQYCNLYIFSNDQSFQDVIGDAAALSHPRAAEYLQPNNRGSVSGMKWGLCVPNGCSQEDITKLVHNGFKHFGNGLTNATVEDCVIRQPLTITGPQITVICIIIVLVLLVIVGTFLDEKLRERDGDESANTSVSGVEKLVKHSPTKVVQEHSRIVQLLRTFSFRENWKLLFSVRAEKGTDTYRFRFLHGARFFAMCSIVLGHSYAIFEFTNISRMTNALNYADNPLFSFNLIGYLSVDTFFFMSGFLLCYNLLKHSEGEKNSSVIAVALLRRYIRGTIPALFVMGLVVLTPLVFDGPTLQRFYHNYMSELSEDWLLVALQVRNFAHGLQKGCMAALWYLSTDFQLFVVSTFIIQFTRRRPKAFYGIFVTLSIASCLYSGISIYKIANITPFVAPVITSIDTINATIGTYYPLPTTHAVVYFTGCLISFFIKRNSNLKLNKYTLNSLHLLALSSALLAILPMYFWNSGQAPGETAKVVYGMTQRLLWAIAAAWTTFICATNRGGLLNTCLSFSAFVPLSRLSFGVYLIHLAYFYIQVNTTRERIFFSNFTMFNRTFSCLVWSYPISAFVFLFLEAPMGRIEKLLLSSRRSPNTESKVTSPEFPESVVTEKPPVNGEMHQPSNGNVVLKNVYKL